MVINDFGEINVDAGLISGQIDEPASIAGGCICCLPDDGQLDAALARLADPRLRLDAIIVEASGLADPAALARIIGFSEIGGVRDGGVVDVIDAVQHFDTVDRGGVAPARYGAATLVVVNKLDQIPDADRDATLRRVEARVRERNSRAHVIGATNGRIDPSLLYDVAAATDETGQLSFREAFFEEPADAHDHVHAESVTVTAEGAVDPERLDRAAGVSARRCVPDEGRCGGATSGRRPRLCGQCRRACGPYRARCHVIGYGKPPRRDRNAFRRRGGPDPDGRRAAARRRTGIGDRAAALAALPRAGLNQSAVTFETSIVWKLVVCQALMKAPIVTGSPFGYFGEPSHQFAGLSPLVPEHRFHCRSGTRCRSTSTPITTTPWLGVLVIGYSGPVAPCAAHPSCTGRPPRSSCALTLTIGCLPSATRCLQRRLRASCAICCRHDRSSSAHRSRQR